MFFLGPATIAQSEFIIYVPLIAPNGDDIIRHDLDIFTPKLTPRNLIKGNCELANFDEINEKKVKLTQNGRDDEIDALMETNKFTCRDQNSICAEYRCTAENFKVILKFKKSKN